MTKPNSARFSGRNDHLQRLDREYYRGGAYVHWVLTIQDRRTGWLTAKFYYKFRELLTHSMFRYGLCCPIYCCMPDHIHMIWLGLLDHSDQIVAIKYFREQLEPLFKKLEVSLQRESYDHVLRNEERDPSAFEVVAEYIARNPERAGLIELDGFRRYPFTGCLIPGYPELTLWKSDSWLRIWRSRSFLRENGLIRGESNQIE